MIPLQTASPHPVAHIVFSPSGSAVAVAQPHYGVTILNRATGGVLAVCAKPRRAELTGLTFCGDGKYLATASAKGLEVFDANTGALAAANFRRDFKSLQLAERDGNVFGLGLCATGLVWRPDVPNIAAFRSDCRPGHKSIALSPDARFALEPFAAGCRVKLYNVDTMRASGQIERHDDADSREVVVAKFCPQSRRFAFNDGRTISVYDAPARAEDEPPSEAASESHPVGTTVAVAPMPHTLLSPVFTLAPESAPEAGSWYPPFALLGDGRGLLVKRPRNRIQWWDAPTGTVVNEWSWQFEWVTCVAASADGLTAVAGGRFGRVLLWDLE